MPKAKRIAVILSGCGHQDGAEITEAVSTLIVLSEAGAQVEIFAPDINFESRNVLKESARIARGKIQPLSELQAKDFDGLAMPGGFGVALVLCDWALKGAKCSVLPDAERVIKEFHSAEKPIAAICIAPALVARVLGSEGITVTIGRDADGGIANTGAIHEDCAVTDYVTDRDHRIITTPAYMYDDAKPFEVFTGIRAALRELVEMA